MSPEASIRLRTLLLSSGFIATIIAGSASAQSLECIAQADKNGDGAVHWEEMVDMRRSIFARFDRNTDGLVNREDRPQVGPAGRRFDEAFTQFKSADANGDGSISREEFLKSPSPAFAAGDTDEDGVLSADELLNLQAPANK